MTLPYQVVSLKYICFLITIHFNEPITKRTFVLNVEQIIKNYHSLFSESTKNL